MERAGKDGVPKAAKNLVLYSWQAKVLQTGVPFDDQRLQQAEMARLKRENTRLAEEVAYFAKEPR